MLIELFDETPWIILHAPMIFKPGVTKSVMLCDVSLRFSNYTMYKLKKPHVQVSYKTIEEIDGLFGPSLFDSDEREEENLEEILEGDKIVDIETPEEMNLKTQVGAEERKPNYKHTTDHDDVESSLSGDEDITSPRNDILTDAQSPRSIETAQINPNKPQLEVVFQVCNDVGAKFISST